jgi:hypothetical protein
MIHEGCLVPPFYISVVLIAELIALCDGRLCLLACLIVGGRLLNFLGDCFQPAFQQIALGSRELRRDLFSSKWLGDSRLSVGQCHLLPFLELLHLHPRSEDLGQNADMSASEPPNVMLLPPFSTS